MTISIDELGHADAPEIARLQFDSWRRAYTEVLSAEYINGAMEGDIAKVWDSWGDDKVVLGARDADGLLVGFATYLISGETYLDNFHIDHRHHGQGVAANLFWAGVDLSAARGAKTLWLTVLESNARARAFYAKMGGREQGAKIDDMLGTQVMAVPVYWYDLHLRLGGV